MVNIKLTPEQRQAERIRMYNLQMNQHKIKNRSTKTILSISIPRWDRYNVCRHVSKTQLEEWAKNGSFEASQELARRNARAQRRAANKGKLVTP